MPVLRSRKFLAQVDAEYAWRERHRSPENADRWYDAVNAAVDELADPAAFPTGYALCHEADELGKPLRQKMFGVGKSKSHRLIFRVTPAAVEVVAVRGFGQRDSTERDV